MASVAGYRDGGRGPAAGAEAELRGRV